MFYLLYGTDQKKVGDQVQGVVNALRAKREFAQVFHIYPDTFAREDLEGIQSSSGLFLDKHVFVYKDLLNANKDTREYMMDKVEEYVSSPHVHIFVEEELDDAQLKAIQKHEGVHIKKYNKPLGSVNSVDVSKKIFSVVSGIANLKSVEPSKRTTAQKINIWKVVDEIREAGTAPEEFFGILWWRYRSTMQVSGATQKASGMTPFSFNEAQKIALSYGKREEKRALKQDMKALLDIYHDSHNGETEMWESLEAWVLG